jgi:hypothetical protein
VTGLAPRRLPCSSCPYRPDTPSGLWAQNEYDRLPAYDGETGEQAMKCAFGVFMCHQRDGNLCAGWVGCHDMAQNLAVRVHAGDLDLDAVLDYVSPVPLFSSGAAAAEHGKRDLAAPGEDAKRKAKMLLRLAARKARGEFPAGEDDDV